MQYASSKIAKRLDKQLCTLNKINNAKPNFAKYFFSFGIYAYLISQKRKEKVHSKIDMISKEINEQKSYISGMENDITKSNDCIKKYTQSIVDKKKSIAKAKKILKLKR